MSAAMRTATTPSADAMWTAFLARDRRWDGRFVAGVRTTGIFCRPTCTCRKPLRRNVRFFASPAAAARAGFRPCKRCRPELAGGASEADRRLAARALTLMRGAPGERWPVRRLARALAMSPSAFARHFRAGAKTTPARALARLRLERAQALLARGERVLDVALEVGFGSGSAFARAWRRQHGVAPARSVPRPIRRRQA
ncbi:MAG: methylphosphotriester-DNA--protein-cysteine methyltransferase family protein [Candidatus Eisenbacteria bacterium]|uniref:Methylphosphotriester-DNA--protein-cysteine methyltransferase family protein n=1 Tax=Eiseniibacteriota bacterium TaxID=2212470 RepID=A0A538U723_UNCEI|nr:MAG: methylphosphotriester-DNA--protein-cysteine methyltransferase family protein [Candidatus Eisenbacteria bacterium]